MSFIILGPSGDGPTGDKPLRENKSDMVDGRFGGQRKTVATSVASPNDYTKRTGAAPNKEENPVDETTRDIDDMTNPNERKREFSYQEEKADVQKGNEADWQTKSDADNRPRMDEGSNAVQVPEVVEERVRKKANQWQYDTSNTYEGEIS